MDTLTETKVAFECRSLKSYFTPSVNLLIDERDEDIIETADRLRILIQDPRRIIREWKMDAMLVSGIAHKMMLQAIKNSRGRSRTFAGRKGLSFIERLIRDWDFDTHEKNKETALEKCLMKDEVLAKICEKFISMKLSNSNFSKLTLAKKLFWKATKENPKLLSAVLRKLT